MFISEGEGNKRSSLCVLAFRVWFPVLALHALVSWFNMWHCHHFLSHCCLSCGQIAKSNDAERSIKFLHRGRSHSCKRATQGLYLCSVVDLEREMPASPCFLPHRGCSVWCVWHNDVRRCLSHSWFLYSNSPCVWAFHCCCDCLGASLDPKVLTIIKERRWRMLHYGLWQRKWSSSQRYASANPFI